MILISVLVILIYLACPLVGKVALLVANSFIPDPLPYVDEIIMWIGLLVHLGRMMKIAEFISNHKILSFFVFLIIIVLLIFGIVMLISNIR